MQTALSGQSAEAAYVCLFPGSRLDGILSIMGIRNKIPWATVVILSVWPIPQ